MYKINNVYIINNNTFILLSTDISLSSSHYGHPCRF